MQVDVSLHSSSDGSGAPSAQLHYDHHEHQDHFFQEKNSERCMKDVLLKILFIGKVSNVMILICLMFVTLLLIMSSIQVL